ncbi:hypothetical protein PHYSODRAFT_248731 [Phytophthora sojae]|uniref:Uncharacterized protein n=1 Tax=Phytophthora sojae (strain P6497) TaxID=1094619 RepID=G4ZYA4_PHYSP|nr:hypothetical protein PHYSODRAFT_248731 [Phytophthora sojae]EGZ12716.1 hypothetical protein PHYSODRAFT_248731 [Phytophthora sojae]|eukprot:XP_009533049.1 hypothetical protein PHYSODRAFT_248731 [Phytophthora sojae]
MSLVKSSLEACTLMPAIPMSELAPAGTTPTIPARPPAGASAAAVAAPGAIAGGDQSDVDMERADGNLDREVVDPADEELGDQDEEEEEEEEEEEDMASDSGASKAPGGATNPDSGQHPLPITSKSGNFSSFTIRRSVSIRAAWNQGY